MPSYVIVGASRGLGYAWLQNLSAEPTNTVIGLARTPGPVKAQLAADKIENVHVVQADMVDNQSLVEAAKEVARLTNGSVDYLIVNGAYLNPTTQALSPVALTSDEALLRQEMQQHLDVNVIGVMLAINAFLPLVRKSSIKKIVALSSGMGVSDFVEKAGISFSVAYGSLKAALNMIIFKYSLELKDEGIVVLALSPGMVNTMVEPRKFTHYSTFSLDNMHHTPYLSWNMLTICSY